jgi:hypothetical protein
VPAFDLADMGALELDRPAAWPEKLRTFPKASLVHERRAQSDRSAIYVHCKIKPVSINQFTQGGGFDRNTR